MPPVTASAVLSELRNHIEKCEMANIQTAHAMREMSDAHRTMAKEMKDTRSEFQANWTALNRNAWKALGAVGITILAGVVGVVVQNWNLHQDTASHANNVEAQIIQRLDILTRKVETPPAPP